MSSPARAERAALCDLFLEVGPDAPTLCGGWTTRDLAAHLVVRERRPDAAPGIVSRVLAGHSEKVRIAETERPWPELVERVRSGPPVWNPMRFEPVDTARQHRRVLRPPRGRPAGPGRLDGPAS